MQIPRLVYFDCPACGNPLGLPFSTGSGPVPFIHNGGPNRRNCRLVVTPYPDGSAAEIDVVPKTVMIEPILRRRIELFFLSPGDFPGGGSTGLGSSKVFRVRPTRPSG